MSKPPAGLYIIYNRVLSPTGEKLAITYNGERNAVTVSPFSDLSVQRVRAIHVCGGFLTYAIEVGHLRLRRWQDPIRVARP